MHDVKIQPWPPVSDELKAHAIAMTIGRYHTSATLIGRLRLETWMTIVAGLIEVEIEKLMIEYGEAELEVPAENPGPILAQDLIRRWKAEPALQERFPSFLDYIESVERAIEQGLPINGEES